MAIYSCRSNTTVNTNYYVDYTASRAGNTTTLNFSLKFVLGSATGLGLRNSRDAEIYVDGSLVKKIEVKNKDTNWSYGTTHYKDISFSIPTTNVVSVNKTCKIKIVVGAYTTGIDSCLWTIYPANFNITIPAAPNAAPIAPTSLTTDLTTYKPGDNIVLTWTGGSDGENNINSYIIEESNYPFSSWNILIKNPIAIGSGSYTTVCPDTRGIQKKYRIKLLDSLNASSNWKESAIILIKSAPLAPTQPIPNVNNVVPGEKIKLSFSKNSSGYQNINNFKVAMKLNGSSSWYNNQQIMGQGSSSPIQINTSGWTIGKTWIFYIKAIDDFGEESEWSQPSNPVSIIAPIVLPPINQEPPSVAITGEYANMGTYEIIKTTKIMNQLKQLDLYRAKYIPSNRTGLNQNAWCFHGGLAQGWVIANNPLFSVFETKTNKLSSTYRVKKQNISINTNTYPYFSFQYSIINKSLSFIAGLYPSSSVINISTVLAQLGVTNIDETSDPSFILIGSYRFCPKVTYVEGTGYTSTYQTFLKYFNSFIKHCKEIYPPEFTIIFYCSDGTSYGLQAIKKSYYNFFSINIASVVSNKTITSVLISATIPSEFPINNNDIKAFQVLYDYIKFDDINVFSQAPIRFDIIKASDENTMRDVVESFLGLNSSTAKWSDKKNRVKASSDLVEATYLENYREKLAPIMDTCKTCDNFTCTCNGISYGGISCSACDAAPGLGSDAGVPCTQCFSTTYSYSVCSCYSPMNALSLGCKCGYASTPMCNGYTCWCNSGTKYVW